MMAVECVRELRWDGRRWTPTWHAATGPQDANPRPIACGEGDFYTIVDPSPVEHRAPTCSRCLAKL